MINVIKVIKIHRKNISNALFDFIIRKKCQIKIELILVDDKKKINKTKMFYLRINSRWNLSRELVIIAPHPLHCQKFRMNPSQGHGRNVLFYSTTKISDVIAIVNISLHNWEVNIQNGSSVRHKVDRKVFVRELPN